MNETPQDRVPRIRAQSNVEGSGVTEVLVPHPKALTEGDYAMLPGDIAVLFVATKDPEVEFVGPSGWTRSTREQFARVVTGDEPWPLVVTFMSRARVYASVAIIDADSVPGVTGEEATLTS